MKEPRVPKCTIVTCKKELFLKGLCAYHYEKGYSDQPIRNPARGTGTTDWSDWRKNSQGYVLRSRRLDYRNVIELQHRHVMEQHIGRPLLKNENVHHKNGDRADNRLENLELWTTSQPKGQRVVDKLAWAYELIRLYEGDISKL